MINEKEVWVRQLNILRKRLLKFIFAFCSIFLAFIYFSNDLYAGLILPLLKQLPTGQSLIAIHLLTPFFVPYKFAFMLSLFVAMPIFLYQLWAFIAPGLYLKERQSIWPLIVLSITLFYLGVAFAYFAIFPVLFHFLVQTTPPGVLLTPDMGEYLEFTLNLFFLFGIIFEIPIVTILLINLRIVTREKLTLSRPYIIVGAFILGMLIGPPDVLSQTLIAIPMWLLFEVGLYLSAFIKSPLTTDIKDLK